MKDSARCCLLVVAMCLVFPVFSPAVHADDVSVHALDFKNRATPFTHFSLTPFIGDYLGSRFSHSLFVGAQGDFRLTSLLSFVADFGWTSIHVDPATPLGQIDTNNNLYSFQGGVTFHFPALYRSGGVVEADLFTTLGGGVLRINNRNRGDGFIGGGLTSYFRKPSWLAIRVELRNYFSSVATATGTQFTSDISITAGPSFNF